MYVVIDTGAINLDFDLKNAQERQHDIAFGRRDRSRT